MAVNKTINKRTNTHGAMRNCIEYVLRQDKTSELLTYVTGPYCHNEINYDLVYRTFLEEKKMWNKDTVLFGKLNAAFSVRLKRVFQST